MLKKYAFICSLIFCYSNVYSQNVATPNPGFENWNQVANYYNAVGWNNLNSNTAPLGVFTCVRASSPADVHSGNYAIKLTTKSVFGITANGISSTATLITTPPYGVSGGIPYTERPDSIVGWYKYTPATSADSGFVQFVLLGAGNDTIGFVRFSTPNSPVATYTRFSAPINYFSTATPTLSYWILSASGPDNPVVNSSLIVDDLDLIFNTTGINDPNNQSHLIQLKSNLIKHYLEVANNSNNNVRLEIFNSTGKVVKEFNVTPGYSQFNVQELSSGVYFFRVLSAENNFTSQGKIVVM